MEEESMTPLLSTRWYLKEFITSNLLMKVVIYCIKKKRKFWLMAQKFSLPISLLMVCFCSWSVLHAQNSQAESLLNNAETFMAAGKHQDALTDYRTIVEKYPNSGYADNALLEIGNFYRITEQNEEEALIYYTRIKEEFPNTESAPAAYYFSSLIRENLALNRMELDAAGNDLVRMLGLYPESDWEAHALFLMGKINYRMGNYPVARSYLQQLLLYYTQASFIPASFILRAKIAYMSGQKKLALEILSRMQTYFPDNHEAMTQSTQLARLIEKMITNKATYSLDRHFPVSKPKSFKSPKIVGIDAEGLIGIVDQNGVHFLSKTGKTPNVNTQVRKAVEFTTTPDGTLALGSKTGITHIQNNTSKMSPVKVEELNSFALDDFGRYYVVEARQKDVLMYDRKGIFLRKLGMEKAKLVRCRGQEIWVLGADGASLIRFSGDLEKNLGTAITLPKIRDFCFDILGNLYVLFEKGYKLAVFSRNGTKKAELDLKNGSYPLRMASAIAVDHSGFLYLVDSKGGAIYRFF
ncbi:MAG: hypothetical protein CR997_02625 [Acidobacteria bacterium]|nr:MAG: hypothetical protein CR997_02625 [Acidobacteriota bacterium]